MYKKYVVVLGDGMADYPDEKGCTPLSLAKKPTIDILAKKSRVGLCQTIPEGMKPGSDTANLSVMGYDPRVCYTGRSPLEAISIGINLGDDDVTFRCNLVTLGDEKVFSQKIMTDYSAGEISSAEAGELIDFLKTELPLNGLELFAGVSYRHCLVRRNGKTGGIFTPPHDITGKCICDFLPKGEFSDVLLSLTKHSFELLSRHPVNIKRIKNGKNPANSIWLWGEGTKPRLESFSSKFGMRGTVISAVDLIKGIGIGAKMKSIDVEGATGTVHTNFEGKARAAIEALKNDDFLYIHLEAPDECGHQGDREGKIKSIELIDNKIVKPITEYLDGEKIPFSLLFVPDHATPLCLRTHTSDPVPYLIYNSENPKGNGATSYDEEQAKKTGAFIDEGHLLIKELLK